VQSFVDNIDNFGVNKRAQVKVKTTKTMTFTCKMSCVQILLLS